MSEDKIGGRLETIALDRLKPDWNNPRFPRLDASSFSSDVDVFRYLDAQFDAVSVAESIARHGFFLSEPLIAIPDNDNFIVLEGNRRLTALRALSDERIRAAMTDPRWRSIEGTVAADLEIPVLIAPSRAAVAPILGYRHVTGITPWDPYQQARYVASLIDDPEHPLSAPEVADLIGRGVSEVRSYYRNYSIVEQARDVFEIADSDRIVDEFGVWTRALTSSGIREYIHAPAPRHVEEGRYPLADESKQPLSELLKWLFGDPRTAQEASSGKQSRNGRVLTDSRQLTRFGQLLANSDAVIALRNGASLAEAESASLDTGARFRDALSTLGRGAKVLTENATPDLVGEHGEAIRSVIGSLEKVLA